MLAYIGMFGKVMKLDVVQNHVLLYSGTKMQLGSEFHPGMIGFVYVELSADTWLPLIATRAAIKNAKDRILTLNPSE